MTDFLKALSLFNFHIAYLNNFYLHSNLSPFPLRSHEIAVIGYKLYIDYLYPKLKLNR